MPETAVGVGIMIAHNMGKYFDPEKMVTVRAAGATAGEIHRQAYAGELSPELPVDPRVLM